MNRVIPLLICMLLIITACGGCDRAAGNEEREINSARSFTHWSQDIRTVETKDSLYFVNWPGDFLKYMDKDTGFGGVLCGKPECTHDSKNCNAYLPYGCRCILRNRGRIYWIDQNSQSDNDKYLLNSVALDGTDRQVNAAYPCEILDGLTGYNYCVLRDGWIYLGDIMKVIENGEQIKYNYVVALPLDNDAEPFEILRERIIANDTVILQSYGDYLYIMTNSISELTDEDDLMRRDFKLRRWNVQAHEFETLYEEAADAVNMPREMWVTDQYVYFNLDRPGEGRIYRYNFSTGGCEYIFGYETKMTGHMGIADGIATWYDLVNNGGIYDLHPVIKDFEGNVLVDKRYTLDLRDVYPDYNTYGMNILGRDEDFVYYGLYGDGGGHISIVTVALDGSSAQVLGTVTERGDLTTTK